MTDVGHRYVSPSGSNSADGLSPATAKREIAAAHDSMQQSGVGKGGTIWLGKGRHPVNNVVLDNCVRLVGAGVHTSRLEVTQPGAFGIKLTHPRSFAGYFTITDFSNTGSGVNGGKAAVWLDDAQETILEQIFVDGFADTYPGPHSFDETPAAFRVEGVQTFGDWIHLRNLRTRGVQAGLHLASGTNGWVSNSAFSGDEHSVEVVKRDTADGKACSWRFHECQFIGGRSGTGLRDFSVIVRSESQSHQGSLKFIGCFLEISNATGPTQGFYVDLSDVIFDDTMFGVTHMPAGGKALRVGPHGEVKFGPYTQDGLDTANDIQVDAGGSLSMWREADWTGP